MTTLHYRTSGEWVQWWLRLKAVFLYPPLVADMGILSLLPGWAPLRHGLSRVKRFVTSTEFSKALSAMTLDLPRMAPKLITAGGWVHVGNRGERLVSGSRGVMLSGGWSSDLHACATLPFLGRWLMRRALAEWRFTFNPEQHPSPMPRVSFVIPHRGRDREPLLRLTLASIMAQRTVSVECIVVEQSPVRELVDVPPGVRYLHLAHPEDPLPWRKAWAFNAGVEAASSDIVVCHDADILAPDRYAEEIVNRFQRHDLDVAHFQRFLFCLNRCDTASLLKGDPVGAVAPERIRQHWQGGTLAIRKSAYGVIGGFDERFVGWTGEDREFFDRCRALNQECEGYLPFIHLWHEPQSTKQGHERERNLAHFNQVLMMPRHERIERLRRHD